MTMIRFRWKYVDLRGKQRGGREVMPRGERAEKRGKKGRETGDGRGREASAPARLIAVDLHDKRSRQLVTKVALRR